MRIPLRNVLPDLFSDDEEPIGACTRLVVTEVDRERGVIVVRVEEGAKQ
jgi:hypothetical protein